MTTEAEVLEGEAMEVVADHPRALVIAQPGNALVARPQDGPADMIANATRLAGALKDIVERQNLYTTIRNKKFPMVEAWMTIGRMDNVVAREAERPIRNDDGSYEGFVELVRLSDGMVIGRASALCGTKDDSPWNSRAEPARRAMAVTRATSRAFRQQYSWIMALAGYEPTPSEEMPHDGREETRASFADSSYGDEEGAAARQTTHRDGLIGKAIAQGNQDFQIRQGPDGPVLPFRVKEGRLSQIAVATGAIATALDTYRDETIGERITVWGHYTDESYDKGNETINYKVLHVERIKTPAFEMPTPDAPEATETPAEPDEAPSLPLPIELDPEERLLIGGGLPG